MLRVDPDPQSITFTHSAMATEFSFQLCGDDPEFLKQTAYEASLLIDSLEQKLSLYQEGSDTSRINLAKKGDVIRISSETLDCLEQASTASRRFNGRFNPFIGRAAIRSKDQENEFSEISGLPSQWKEPSAIIAIDKNARSVEKIEDGYLLDLGAIGKGFALDQTARFLEEWDAQNGLLNAGGSSLLLLPDSDNKKWKIEYGEYSHSEKLSFPPGMSLASSGLFFQNEHIIDPKDGKSHSFWKRVHVIAADAALADAASTAAMLLDEEQLTSAAKGDDVMAFLLQGEPDNSLISIGSFFTPLVGPQK